MGNVSICGVAAGDGRQWHGNVALFPRLNYLKEISLAGCVVEGDISMLLTCFKNLTNLKMPGCKRIISGSMTQSTFDAICSLENFDAEGSGCEFEAWVIAHFMQSGRRLKEIKHVPHPSKMLGSAAVFKFVGSDLRVVNLSGCSKVKGDISVFQGNANLEDLDLYHCEEIKGVFTGAVVRMITNINTKEGADLRGCGIFTLAEDLSDIHDMTLIDLDGITTLQGDISVLQNSANLEDLNLQDCSQITGDLSVLQTNANLKDINLQGCKGIKGVFTGAGIRMVTNINTKGGKVDLTGCGTLTLAEDLSDIRDIAHIDLHGITGLQGDISAFQSMILDLDFSQHQSYSRIQGLNLQGCSELTGDIKVFQHTPLLQTLNLSGLRFDKMKIEGDIQVFLTHKSLREAKFEFCPNITGDKEGIMEKLPQCKFSF